jgi:hypothetical protein
VISAKTIQVAKEDTSMNLADLLTKCNPGPTLKSLISKVLWGHIWMLEHSNTPTRIARNGQNGASQASVVRRLIDGKMDKLDLKKVLS